MKNQRKERFYFGEPEAPLPTAPLQPGVSAVLMDDARRILFLKRARSAYWSLPGGRIEPYESAAECCVREMREETGLHTRVLRLISVNSHPQSIVVYPDGNIHRSFVLCFLVEHVGGKLQCNEEAERFAWWTLEDLFRFPIIPDSWQNALDAWADRAEAFVR